MEENPCCPACYTRPGDPAWDNYDNSWVKSEHYGWFCKLCYEECVEGRGPGEMEVSNPVWSDPTLRDGSRSLTPEQKEPEQKEPEQKEPEQKEPEYGPCPICYLTNKDEEWGERIWTKSPCGHDYCSYCYQDIVERRQTCSLCRTDLGREPSRELEQDPLHRIMLQLMREGHIASGQFIENGRLNIIDARPVTNEQSGSTSITVRHTVSPHNPSKPFNFLARYKFV